MNNKKLFIILFILLIGSAIFIYNYKFSYPNNPNLRDDLIELGSNVCKLFSVSTSPTGFNSLSTVQQINESTNIILKKLKKYQPLIDRLNIDPDIKLYKIPRIIVYLFFMEGSLVQDDISLKSLVEYPATKLVRKLVLRRPKKRNPIKVKWVNPYNQFLTYSSIKQGQRFIRSNLSLLKRIEAKYNVPKEYLVSILFVETQFGQLTGDRHVPSVYTSLYHYKKEDLINKIITDNEYQLPSLFKSISEIITYRSNPLPLIHSFNFFKNYFLNGQSIKPGSSFIYGTKKNQLVPSVEEVSININELLERKREWSYKEIKSLLIMSYQRKINIYQLKGSWAGAFGLCQFIPSSYLSLALDGNNDGMINLFSVEDALESIANYLNRANFNFRSRKHIRRAIYHYNFSFSYVDTVEKYAHAIK
ncbi:MAG: lytic murein transglycosylase [Spirochaetota bacterium]|nr:lytic murein transglycosylase [Spirochaetota bacterium]